MLRRIILETLVGMFPADITGALKSVLPEGSITTSCPISAYKQQQDGTIQLLAPAASSSSDSTDQAVVATCNILIGEQGCIQRWG